MHKEEHVGFERAGVERTRRTGDRRPPAARLPLRPAGLGSPDVSQLQRQYGNRVVQRLLAPVGAREIPVQRVKITFTGTVTEASGKLKKKVPKTIVVDTEEQNDETFLARIAEGRKLDSSAIDLLPEQDLTELLARLEKLGPETKKTAAPLFKKVRTALANRQQEKEEAAVSAEPISLEKVEEEVPKEQVPDAEQWAQALAGLRFKEAVTEKFQLDHVLQVASATNEGEVDAAAKSLFESRLKGQPNLPQSTLIVFDAKAQDTAIAEVKDVNHDMSKLPYRGLLLTTKVPYLMVTVKKSERDPSVLEVARLTTTFVYTTDQSTLWVQGPKKHIRAMNHLERVT